MDGLSEWLTEWVSEWVSDESVDWLIDWSMYWLNNTDGRKHGSGGLASKRGTSSVVHDERTATGKADDCSSESIQHQQSSAGCESESTERRPVPVPVVADSEQIELEISAELARCCCPVSFPCERLDDCRYKVLRLRPKKNFVSGNPTDPSFYTRPSQFYGLYSCRNFLGSVSSCLLIMHHVRIIFPLK